MARSFLDSSSVSLPTGMPVQAETTRAMSSSPMLGTFAPEPEAASSSRRFLMLARSRSSARFFLRCSPVASGSLRSLALFAASSASAMRLSTSR